LPKHGEENRPALALVISWQPKLRIDLCQRIQRSTLAASDSPASQFETKFPDSVVAALSKYLIDKIRIL
jgi:hypothetical protein